MSTVICLSDVGVRYTALKRGRWKTLRRCPHRSGRWCSAGHVLVPHTRAHNHTSLGAVCQARLLDNQEGSQSRTIGYVFGKKLSARMFPTPTFRLFFRPRLDSNCGDIEHGKVGPGGGVIHTVVYGSIPGQVCLYEQFFRCFSRVLIA